MRGLGDKERCLQEAYALAAIANQCPYIVKFYTAWLESGRLYTQLELCPHGTLSGYLKDQRGKAEQEAAASPGGTVGAMSAMGAATAGEAERGAGNRATFGRSSSIILMEEPSAPNMRTYGRSLSVTMMDDIPTPGSEQGSECYTGGSAGGRWGGSASRSERSDSIDGGGGRRGSAMSVLGGGGGGGGLSSRFDTVAEEDEDGARRQSAALND